MGKITERRQNFLCYIEDLKTSELLLRLCAQGYSDRQIADELISSGAVSRVVPEDVALYKEQNRVQINAYLARNAKEIAKGVTRASPVYRMAETDTLLARFVEGIHAQLSEDPAKAVPMMRAYLQMVEFMGKQAGNFGSGESTNTFLQAMQKATPDEKLVLTKMINDLTLLCQDILGRQDGPAAALPGPRVIDAEYEAEEKQ